jgi:hypothetical protein
MERTLRVNQMAMRLLVAALLCEATTATKLEVVVVEQIPFAARQGTWVGEGDSKYHG